MEFWRGTGGNLRHPPTGENSLGVSLIRLGPTDNTEGVVEFRSQLHRFQVEDENICGASVHIPHFVEKNGARIWRPDGRLHKYRRELLRLRKVNQCFPAGSVRMYHQTTLAPASWLEDNPVQGCFPSTLQIDNPLSRGQPCRDIAFGNLRDLACIRVPNPDLAGNTVCQTAGIWRPTDKHWPVRA